MVIFGLFGYVLALVKDEIVVAPLKPVNISLVKPPVGWVEGLHKLAVKSSVLPVKAPEPLIIDNTPVPTEGVVGCNVYVVALQSVVSTPPFAVTGRSLVKVTDELEEQAPFVTVQRAIVDVPAVTPFIVVEALFVEAIEPAPLTTDHTPVPTEGVLPTNENVLLSHCGALAVTVKNTRH